MPAWLMGKGGSLPPRVPATALARETSRFAVGLCEPVADSASLRILRGLFSLGPGELHAMHGNGHFKSRILCRQHLQGQKRGLGTG